MQLLWLAQKEELDAWAFKVDDSCHVLVYSRGSYKLYIIGLIMPLTHRLAENMGSRGRCILAGECLLATKRRGHG